MEDENPSGPNDQSPEVVRFYELLKLRQQGVDIGAGVTLSDGTVLHNPVTRKVISADKWATRQIKRASDAADDWKEGVKSPSRPAAEAAIANKEKWANKTKEAIANDSFAKGLAKVTQADINTVVDMLGSGVFSSGIAAREPKIKRVVGDLQPRAQAVSDTIQAMPSATDADREKRLTTARKLMIEVGKAR